MIQLTGYYLWAPFKVLGVPAEHNLALCRRAHTSPDRTFWRMALRLLRSELLPIPHVFNDLIQYSFFVRVVTICIILLNFLLLRYGCVLVVIE